MCAYEWASICQSITKGGEKAGQTPWEGISGIGAVTGAIEGSTF